MNMKARKKRHGRNRDYLRSGERKPSGRQSGHRKADRSSESVLCKRKARQKYRRRAAIIICGTRTFDDAELLGDELKRLTRNYHVTHVYVGGDYDKDKSCRHHGADKFGHDWALGGNLPIGVQVFTCWADWRKNKKAAGPIRNSELVKELLQAPVKVKACIAFWDGKSPGTLDTMRKCKREGIVVKVIRYRS